MSNAPNDVDRRFLLGTLAGVAGVAAVSHMAKAGPLNPPAGPVGSTGRTLDEVYNKIPAAIGGGTGDGRIPIPGGTTPVNITEPGSYVLTGNITTASLPLTITAPNVTLDLGGWTVTCTGTSGPAVFTYYLAANAMLRNGRIIGGSTGVAIGGSPDLLLEDLDIVDAANRGVSFSGGLIPGPTFRRLRIIRCGAANPTATAISGIYLGYSPIGAPGYRIEDCTIRELGSTTVPAGSQRYGIYCSQGPGVVCGCDVSATVSTSGSWGYILTNSGLLRNSTSQNFATAFDARDGGGNFGL